MIKTVRILQTSDLHGYIYPRSYATLNPEKIGIAQLSNKINEYRNENTLLVDSGDTIQGSPMMYYLNKNKYKINPISSIMNYLNYDYVTIGNHEFNYGREYLSSYLEHVNATILNCNILKDGQPFYGVPYEIKIVNSIKIAMIGVTTHYIPNWEQHETIKDLEFVDAFTALKKTVETIKDIVDLVIVSYHGGFERDLTTFELNVEDTGENQGFKMLKEIDGIDIFLTGHQHRSLSGKLFNTHYVQPGYYGNKLSLIDVQFNTLTKEINIQTELLEPSNSVDENLLNIVDQIEEKTNIFLDTAVGYTTQDLLIKNQLDARINKHPLVSLINHIQKDFTKSDIALCSLGNNVAGFNKDITIRDIISTYIYPNILIVKELSASTLIKGLEKTAGFFSIENGQVTVNNKFKNPKVQLYAYDMYDGISYTIDLKKPIGNRITNLTFNNLPLDLNRMYTVSMNNYRASGGGDYLFYKDAKTISNTQTEILEIMIDYIYKEKELFIEHKNNIKIVY